jgi:hypothetical protein
MDRRKGGNRDANGSLVEATASRLRVESDEEAEEVGMEVEESFDAGVEDEQAAAEVIGSEKTSADYYFDSYSHFGTRAPSVHFALFSRRFVCFCVSEASTLVCLWVQGSDIVSRMVVSGEKDGPLPARIWSLFSVH